MQLRVADIRWHVDTAAPWIASEIFVQGCFRACPGCFNTQTWDPDSGYAIDTDDIIMALRQHVSYRRLTISGGEPILQAQALADMLSKLRALDKWTILCYTGYTWEDLCTIMWSDVRRGDDILNLLMNIDILVDGPFMAELSLPMASGRFVGSTNQRIIDVRKSLGNRNFRIHQWKEPIINRIKRIVRHERVERGGAYNDRRI